MIKYRPFVSYLEVLLESTHSDAEFRRKAESAVNGMASSKLEQLIPRAQLKISGAFFSSPSLALKVTSRWRATRREDSCIAVDPSCGAGNLLLAAASTFPVARKLSTTLTRWGKLLAGFDIHQEFVDATRLRLALLACYNGAKFDLPSTYSIHGYFPKIRVGNGTRELASVLGNASHLLLNPPFTSVDSPSGCDWVSGKVNQAALFLVQCINQVKPGTQISAILPDVLRAGSRYEKWRKKVESLALVEEIQLVGNFETADVDVFVLHLKVAGDTHAHGLLATTSWWCPSTSRCISDEYQVKVGSVVRHRVDERHASNVYVHAKGLPYWGEISSPLEMINFTGRLEQPPFVVVRRTSSPTDRHRAIATVVTGKQKVAVDNHLIICSPKAGGLASCKSLIKTLQHESTTTHLNDRIRCRHLTVRAVGEIPLIK